MHHTINKYQLRLDVQCYLWPDYLFTRVLYFISWGVMIAKHGTKRVSNCLIFTSHSAGSTHAGNNKMAHFGGFDTMPAQPVNEMQGFHWS